MWKYKEQPSLFPITHTRPSAGAFVFLAKVSTLCYPSHMTHVAFMMFMMATALPRA